MADCSTERGRSEVVALHESLHDLYVEIAIIKEKIRYATAHARVFDPTHLCAGCDKHQTLLERVAQMLRDRGYQVPVNAAYDEEAAISSLVAALDRRCV